MSEREPAWSPDGGSIAVVVDGCQGDQDTEIYLFDVVSPATNICSQQRRVVTQAGFNNHPAWSPDGQFLTFNRTVQSTRDIFIQHRNGIALELRYQNLQVRNGTQLDLTIPFGPRRAAGSAWSPDGTRLVMMAHCTTAATSWCFYITNLAIAGSTIDATTPVSYKSVSFEPYGGPHWTLPIICPSPLAVVNNDASTSTEICTTPTPECIFCTNTPRPEPTLTPTPSWQDLATIFPLPMQPTSGTSVRLSDTAFTDRAWNAAMTAIPVRTRTPIPLCSRDMNPISSTLPGEPLIVSSLAEIWLVDDMDPAIPTYNQNLGTFTVVRLPVNGLPPEIVIELRNNIRDQRIRQVLDSTQPHRGWLYVGYAHQQTPPLDRPGLNGTPAYPIRHTGGNVGTSGNTGIPGNVPHLDISVYYISGNVMLNGTMIGAQSPERNLYGSLDEYEDYFRLFKNLNSGNLQIPNRYGLVELIDPLVIWPLLERVMHFSS